MTRIKEMEDRYLFKVQGGNKNIEYYYEELAITSSVVKLMLDGEVKARLVNKKGKHFFTTVDGSSFVEIRVSEKDRHELVNKTSDYDINDLR